MLALAATLLIVFLGLYRLRWAVTAFIGMLPFFPRVLAIGINDGGLAFTERRMGILVLVMLLIAYNLVSPLIRKRLVQFFKKNRILIGLLISMLLVKGGSTFIHSGFGSIPYWIDEVLFSLVLTTAVYISISSEKDERHIISIILLGVAISGLLSFVEQIKGGPLLQGLVEVQVEVSNDLMEGRVRDDHLRSQALFDNPLLLAEFVCISFPLAIFGSFFFRGWQRYVSRGALIASPYILWAAYTRSGLLVSACGLAIFALAIVWAKSAKSTKALLFMLVVIILSFAVYIAADIVVNPLEYIDAKAEGGASLVERASQYIVVGQAVTGSPVIGYGLTQNFVNDLDFLNHLDNYWLRILLEGGVVSFVIFASMIGRLMATSIHQVNLSRYPIERWYYAAVSASIASFALYKLFVSMPSNNVYFYVLMAVLLAHIRNRSYYYFKDTKL